MHLAGVRSSVRPSVLLQVCCCGPGRQEMSIDCSTAHSSLVCHAGSATLSAYVIAEHRLVLFLLLVFRHPLTLSF